MPEESRTYVGPNAYLTPGGGFTQLHMDGHGTVDSGHTCINGFNEVIMLRRLDEDHVTNACRMVPTVGDGEFNALFHQAHDGNEVGR